MIENKSSNESLYCKRVSISDIFLKALIYVCAGISIFVLIGIISYILINGLPYVSLNFITSPYSESNDQLNGILPMIINTLYIIAFTLLISIPTGISTAIYLTQYAKQNYFTRMIRFATETLSGIPSIIFGLFGYSVFCVIFRLGTSILSGCLTMTLCILPIIIRTTEEALISVPETYKEGALALGAGKLRVIMGIVVPSASSGIVTSIILATGRIIGESAALIYTSGMAYSLPKSFTSHILSSGRTLTLHLYQTAKQAYSEDSLQKAFATASVLLILVFILNIIVNCISSAVKKSR